MKPGTILTAALAAILAPLLLGCSSPAENIPAAPEIDWELDGPKPIASSSRVPLTSDQIWEISGDYMAVNLWAFVAGETAREDPGNFHQTFFSEPDRGCVDRQRNLLLESPDPPIEGLLECGRESAALGRDVAWADISDVEQEARARRAVGLLLWSIDPPSAMTVQIAVQRGLDVSVRTNPEFARFATQYDICERVSQERAGQLAGLQAPREMAEEWTQIERRIRECADRVTQEIFRAPGPQQGEVSTAAPDEPHQHDGMPEHTHDEAPAEEDGLHEHIGLEPDEHGKIPEQEPTNAD